MSDNLLVENLRQKWQPVIEHADMPSIKDDYRKNITAIMLENQEKALREAEIANHSGTDSVFGDTSGAFNAVSGFNPVLISLVRRAMPNLIAYDVCGVQPMSGPTGLIFAMKAKFGNHGSAEALFDEAPTGFGATPGFAGTADGVGFPTCPAEICYTIDKDNRFNMVMRIRAEDPNVESLIEEVSDAHTGFESKIVTYPEQSPALFKSLEKHGYQRKSHHKQQSFHQNLCAIC